MEATSTMPTAPPPRPPPQAGEEVRAPYSHCGIRALTGSLTFSTFSNSTLLQFAADLLDPAEIDGLDDVARLRVDRDRAARAFPCQPLGGRDQRVAVGLAAGLLERLVDDVHAVIAADREDSRGCACTSALKAATKALFSFEVMVVVVVERRDHAERRIAHAVQRVLLGDLALPEDLDLAWHPCRARPAPWRAPPAGRRPARR